MLKYALPFLLSLIFSFSVSHASSTLSIDKIVADAEAEYELMRRSGNANCSGPMAKAADQLLAMIPNLSDIDYICKAAEASYDFSRRGHFGRTDHGSPFRKASDKLHRMIQTLSDIDSICKAAEASYDLSRRGHIGRTNHAPPLISAAHKRRSIIKDETEIAEVVRTARASYDYFFRTRSVNGMTDCSAPIKDGYARVRVLMKSLTDKQSLLAAATEAKKMGGQGAYQIDQYALELVSKIR